MRIGFHHDSFSLRGVDQASYEYARICEEILGDEIIILKSNLEESRWISDHTSRKIRKRFRVCEYNGSELELQRLVQKLSLDSLYTLNTGYLDQRFRNLECPVWNHSVFPESKMRFQAEGFAVVSEWLSKEYFSGKCRVVPHVVPCIDKSHNLRSELGIPTGDLVLGSMGGRWNFNSKTAIGAVAKALEKRNDLWFISLNQVICASHRRIITLPGTGLDSRKHAFIETCDYMLHGRSEGETFGISCGEFCRAGKPILAWRDAPQRAHLEQFVLNENIYSNANDLEEAICSLDRLKDGCDKSRALAMKYSDTKVAGLFRQVFHQGRNVAIEREMRLDRIRMFARYCKRRSRVRLMKRDQYTKKYFLDYCGVASLTE